MQPAPVSQLKRAGAAATDGRPRHDFAKICRQACKFRCRVCVSVRQGQRRSRLFYAILCADCVGCPLQPCWLPVHESQRSANFGSSPLKYISLFAIYIVGQYDSPEVRRLPGPAHQTPNRGAASATGTGAIPRFVLGKRQQEENTRKRAIRPAPVACPSSEGHENRPKLGETVQCLGSNSLPSISRVDEPRYCCFICTVKLNRLSDACRMND